MAIAPGEPFYGEAIAKTLPTCWSDNEDDRVFRAVLVAETTNSTRTRWCLVILGEARSPAVGRGASVSTAVRRDPPPRVRRWLLRGGHEGWDARQAEHRNGLRGGVGPLHGIPYGWGLSSR